MLLCKYSIECMLECSYIHANEIYKYMHESCDHQQELENTHLEIMLIVFTDFIFTNRAF